MTKQERIAITRVFADLIKADGIIDEGEMNFYGQVLSRYGIQRPDETEACGLTLAHAIGILQTANSALKRQVLHDCRKLTLSDGSCDKTEALILLALHYCFSEELCETVSTISVPYQEATIEESHVIYVESTYDEDINHQIQKDFRSLNNEFKLTGFNLVYIPQIIYHYHSVSPELMNQVYAFLMPLCSENRIASIKQKLANLRTQDFVQEILCNKLGLESLRLTPPALLLSIGQNDVNNERYVNFLKMDIDGCNVHHEVCHTSDLLKEMITLYPGTNVSIIEDAKGQFLYKGFYKQLFDLYALPRHVQSRVTLQPLQEKIVLTDLDWEMKGLHRKEKALYALFLLESRQGGISFSAPTSSLRLVAYKRRMEQLKRKYAYLYECFGGEKEKAPDIELPEIRRPMLSRIKKEFIALGNKLHTPEQYVIQRGEHGIYNLGLPPELIWTFDCENATALPVWEAPFYRFYERL